MTGRPAVEDQRSDAELDSIRCGFAAGCEARLCLAGQFDFGNRAMPLVWALPQNFGPKAGPWAQPETS